MMDLAYQAGDSILHRMNSTVKFIGLILTALLILYTRNLTCVVVTAGIFSLLMIFSKLSIQTVFQPLKRLVFFLTMIFLMNALFFQTGSCLFSVWIICVSKAGIEQGLNVVLHTFAITILSSLFIRTTTSVEIIHGLENITRPLRIFGLPTRDIALIMSIALQFIPVFFSDFDRIRKTQIARGADFSGASIRKKAEAIFPLVIPAFISAFRRADELSLAIEARGFQSEKESFEK